MKLTAEQLAQFDEEGYLFFPEYFSPEETRILKASVPEVFAQRRQENVREKTGDVVRGALDGAAARLAAAHYTPELVHRGRLLLDVGRRAVASGNIPSVIEADIDFHLFIYEASGNPLIGETAQPHWQHLRRVMAAALGESDLRVSVWDEHEGILRALETGQAAEAEALARDHAVQMADILTGRLRVVISRAA